MRFNKWLILVILLAFGLRTWNVNWDSGYHFHPDERWIVMVTEKIEWVNPVTDWENFNSVDSRMNPGFFAYGSLPIYLLKLVSEWAAEFLGNLEFARYAKMNLVGRVMNALFDTGTVGLVYLLGCKLFCNLDSRFRENDNVRRKVEVYALWAAGLYAVSVFPIQNSHFYTVDVMLAFFVTLGIYLSVRLTEGHSGLRSKGLIILLGIVWGMAVAIKVSGLFLGISIGVAIIISNIKYQIVNIQLKSKKVLVLEILSVLLNAFWRRVGWRLLIVFMVTVLTSVILQPYVIIDGETFLRNLKEQSMMTRDAWVFPYSRQYVGTVSYIYFIEQYVRFGVGWGLGLLSLFGMGLSGWWLVRRSYVNKLKRIEINRSALLVVLPFVVFYFGYIGQSEVKFMRYMLPLYPMMSLFGVVGIIYIKYQMSKIKYNVSVKYLYGLIFGMTLLWTVGFMTTVYGQENTRIQASQYLDSRFKMQDSKVVLGIEHWDDALPVPPWNQGFVQEELPLYEFDSVTKWSLMSQKLEKVDAIVLASNRLSTPLVKIGSYDPRYEITKRYYELLFNGGLGFDEVVDYHVQPGMGPWKVDTQQADESFQIYDHPRVRIFVKFKNLTAFDYYYLIVK